MNERELIQQLRDTIANDCAPYMGHTGVVVQALRAADAYLAAPVAPADGWEHLKVYGYAPGDYMSRCHKCGLTPAGLDKRATTCRPCAEAMHAAAPAELPTTRSQRMRDAGFTRRPTWHSLPGDDEPPPVAPVGMAYVPLVMTQAMRDVTDSEGWTWEDLLAAAEAITESQYEKLAAAAAPVAPVDPTVAPRPYNATPDMIAAAKRIDPALPLESVRAMWTAMWTAGRIAAPVAPAEPIDMVLHCPNCGAQHIDGPEPGTARYEDGLPYTPPGWTNPPHRSHLCHGCGHVWRPADVLTNGVAAVQTKGGGDSPITPGWMAAPVAPADYPECSGDPNCCPENEGFGCCKAPAEQSHAVSYMEGISDGRAEAAPALVPLTSEQITKAWHDAEGTRNGYGPFARAIEASHGIKP